MRNASAHAAPRRSCSPGRWHVVVAMPAMLGSLAIVAFLAGVHGGCAALVPLAWLAVGPLWLTAAGERIAVRVAFGYRRPPDQARTKLAHAIEAARARCGGDLAAVVLYVRPRATALNAYAAGGRSVAVTAGLVDALACGTLSPAEGGALLAHEIGHLRARDTRYGLAVAWLTAPWRAVVTVFGGPVRLIVDKMPTARAAVLVLWPLVLVVTAVQAVQQDAWVTLAVLVTVGVVLAVQPLVDAALIRAGERAADDYAIGLGAGPDLAAALSRISTAPREAGRLRDTHPARADRIARLAAGATATR